MIDDQPTARPNLVVQPLDRSLGRWRRPSLSFPLPTSSLEFKVSYLKQLNQMVPPFAPELRPEARWMVDPDDYVKPLVYDPKDARWTKPSRASQGACR